MLHAAGLFVAHDEGSRLVLDEPQGWRSISEKPPRIAAVAAVHDHLRKSASTAASKTEARIAGTVTEGSGGVTTIFSNQEGLARAASGRGCASRCAASGEARSKAPVGRW